MIGKRRSPGVGANDPRRSCGDFLPTEIVMRRRGTQGPTLCALSRKAKLGRAQDHPPTRVELRREEIHRRAGIALGPDPDGRRAWLSVARESSDARE